MELTGVPWKKVDLCEVVRLGAEVVTLNDPAVPKFTPAVLLVVVLCCGVTTLEFAKKVNGFIWPLVGLLVVSLWLPKVKGFLVVVLED